MGEQDISEGQNEEGKEKRGRERSENGPSGSGLCKVRVDGSTQKEMLQSGEMGVQVPSSVLAALFPHLGS